MRMLIAQLSLQNKLRLCNYEDRRYRILRYIRLQGDLAA